MAWSISNAMMKDYESWLCSRERVAEYSEDTCAGESQSAQSNTTPMPDQYYWPDKTTEHSRLFRFGMTCVPLSPILGDMLLTWYRGAFLARTSVQQEMVKESKEKNQGYGKSKSGSFAKLIPGTVTWKTPQGSLLEDSILFLQTWPKWGSMQNGECFLREKPVLAMNVSESGYWLPTPTAHNAKEGNYPSERMRHTPSLAAVLGGKINPEFTEWMMGWPVGWTDLKPLGTDKFQSWKQQHGKS